MDTIILIALGVVSAFVISMVALPFAIGQAKGDVQVYNQQRTQVIKTAENYYTETNVNSVNYVGSFPQLPNADEGEKSGADEGDVVQENPNVTARSKLDFCMPKESGVAYDPENFIQEQEEQEVWLSSDEGRIANTGQEGTYDYSKEIDILRAMR